MLWLLAAYLLLSGPILYAECSGFVPKDTYVVAFTPLYATVNRLDTPLTFFGTSSDQVVRGFHTYTGWWSNQAARHGRFRSVQLSR